MAAGPAAGLRRLLPLLLWLWVAGAPVGPGQELHSQSAAINKCCLWQRCPALAQLLLPHAVRAVHAVQEVRKVMVSLDDSGASRKALEVLLLVLLL